MNKFSLSLITGLIGLSLSLSALSQEQIEIQVRSVKLIEQDGLQFKDLNKDGRLNPYEDWRLSALERAQDLVSRMTLEEKAGVMMHGSAPAPGSIIGVGTEYDLPATRKMIIDEKVNTFITRLITEPGKMAEENNKLQAIAESSRLGIPLTISIDPRSTYQYSTGNKTSIDGFSKWPETLGIAAIGDEELTRQYANIARQEYRLLGVTQALSPMADLATEPRWSRIAGTFGEDPELVKKMVRGYIIGMQDGNRGLNAQSVSAVVKHWVGYGAAEHGFDSHSSYGKYADFSSHNLAEHIYPFTGAFEAGVSGVMPTYSILKNLEFEGRKIEQVAAGFNHYLLQDLLRNKYQFKGIIISDWLITDDCKGRCITGYPQGQTPTPDSLGMPWGVEELSKTERFAKAVNAGIDQFGGVTDIAPLVEAFGQGLISQQRLDQAVSSILQQKFELGLFENPYVDATLAAQSLPNPKWQQQADKAQSDALVLLEKKSALLPLKANTKVYLKGINADVAKHSNLQVVEDIRHADVALFRIVAPFEQPHKNYFFGAMYHEGSLAFSPDHPDRIAIEAAAKMVPTIVTIYLDRPAILTPLKASAEVIIANFGVSDKVLLQALTQPHRFKGKLPFELPSSMEQVLKQHSDKPYDSEAPLYDVGYGLKQ